MTRDERQKLGVSKWISSGCRGTLSYATGVGKTRTALIAIKSFLSKNSNKKITIIVPTEHLKVQWIQELIKYNLFSYANVEIINSAIKKEEKVDLLILDEAHRYAGNLYIEIFRVKNPTLVLGLSATFNRLDGKHELLNKFCPVCDVISTKEAIKNNWLSPYKEYKVLIEVENISDYLKANENFQNAFSMFNYDFNLAMNCVTNIIKRRVYAKKLGIAAKELDAITFNWLRSLRERKEFVMNHPKKIDITRQILLARPNSKAITFSSTIKQAEKIKIGYLVHSGKTKKKNAVTINEFKNVKTGVINAAKALDEGTDIPGLNLAIVLSNSSSQTQKTQRVGRVIRYEEGKEAEIFTLVIKNTMEENWYNNSNVGKNFIEINELELTEILNGGKIDNVEREGKEVSELFRL